jgi:hypothetical protein
MDKGMELPDSFASRLFEISPYKDFDASNINADLQGWGSDHPVFEHVIGLTKPFLIVEVGSWKGRSAINMAKIAKKNLLSCEILCIDTWLGSPEHWLKQEPDWYSSLQIKNGFPRLYFTFLANVVNNQCSDLITPFPSTSENAAAILKQFRRKIDMCYIDAAHEYEPVMRDLEIYWDLMAEDSILIGDDYVYWPGVTKAANEFAKKKKIRLQGEEGKFVIAKGKWEAVNFLKEKDSSGGRLSLLQRIKRGLWV